jgi:hypothetical protein
LKYLSLIAVGLPIWFVIGILITFSPEFAKTLNILQPVAVGRAVMFTYVGVVLGDLLRAFFRNDCKAVAFLSWVR